MAQPTPAARVALAAGGLAGGLIAGGLAGTRLARRAPPGPGRARRAAEIARRAGSLQSDLHAIRQALEERHHRSPLEVVLEGLTHRPGDPR